VVLKKPEQHNKTVSKVVNLLFFLAVLYQLLSFLSILTIYYVTAFVEYLTFYQDSIKFPMNSLEISMIFSCKQNFMKFYITSCTTSAVVVSLF